MAHERGLVISPPIEIGRDVLSVRSSCIDPQELRTYILFWDRLDWPSNNIIRMASGPDEQFLEQAGILTRTPIRIAFSGNGSELYRLAHLTGYKELETKEPGVWSLARGEKSLTLYDDDLEIGRGILISLYDSIPVPDKDVPLDEILSFKARRSDELGQLRTHLEQLYQKIISQPDLDLAILTEKTCLDKSLTDYIKVAKEQKSPFKLAKSLSARFTLSTESLTRAGIAASATMSVTGNTLAGTITGLASMIQVSADAGLKAHSKDETPFEYVADYHTDLFI